jgi:hypothetical protein
VAATVDVKVANTFLNVLNMVAKPTAPRRPGNALEDPQWSPKGPLISRLLLTAMGVSGSVNVHSPTACWFVV